MFLKIKYPQPSTLFNIYKKGWPKDTPQGKTGVALAKKLNKIFYSISLF